MRIFLISSLAIIAALGNDQQVPTPSPTIGYEVPSECDPGTFHDGFNCQDCPFGSYTDKPGMNHCTYCPGNLVTKQKRSDAEEDCVCPPHTIEREEYCYGCPKGEYYEDGTCLQCPIGTYRASEDPDAKCIFCSAGRTTVEKGANSQVQCVCKPNYIDSSRGACIECSQGEYYNVSLSSCLECPMNSYVYESKRSCVECPNNMITTASHATSVTDCHCKSGTHEDAAGDCIDDCIHEVVLTMDKPKRYTTATVTYCSLLLFFGFVFYRKQRRVQTRLTDSLL